MRIEAGPSIATTAPSFSVGRGSFGSLPSVSIEAPRALSSSIGRPSIDLSGGTRVSGSLKSIFSETRPVVVGSVNPLDKLPTSSELSGFTSEIFSRPSTPTVKSAFTPENPVPQGLRSNIFSETVEHQIVNPPSVDRLPSRAELSDFTTELFTRTPSPTMDTPKVTEAPKSQQKDQLSTRTDLVLRSVLNESLAFPIGVQEDLEQAERTLKAFEAAGFAPQRAKQIVVEALRHLRNTITML